MKISKLLLCGALIVLMIASFPVSGFAGGEPTSPPDPLVIYAESFTNGLVLDYAKADVFEEWSEPYNLEELDGLVWTLRGKVEDGDEQDLEFKLVYNKNALVITYLEEDESGDKDGEPLEVFFKPLADIELTETEVKETELLYLIKGSPTNKIGKKEESGESGLRARVMQQLGAKTAVEKSIIVDIPEDFLILYADYEAAHEASRSIPDDPDVTDGKGNGKEGDGEEDETEDVTESDRLLRELIKELKLDRRFNEHAEKGSARIVLDVTYNEKTKEWSLDKDSGPEVVPSGYEAMDASNRTLIMAGMIAVMVICAVSLVMSALLVLKKARR